MAVTGYLVPFPDPGAFDLMSRWLEQEVEATGPGVIVARLSMPRVIVRSTGGGAPSPSQFARKKLELFRQQGDGWELLSESVTPSPEATEEVRWDVTAAATYRSRLTNLGSVEGQFSLDCRYLPADLA